MRFAKGKLIGWLGDGGGRYVGLMYAKHPGCLWRRLYLHLEHKMLRRKRVLTVPARVKLNTGYLCNLRCPLCPTGKLDEHPGAQLTLGDAKRLLPYLKRTGIVSLYGWAEPFLNRDIFEIIKLFKENRVYVEIDSNLSIENQRIVDKIAQSPIDLLSVSVDGADQESYAQYRVGGSFDRVISNIRKLKASSNGPRRIQWQYLVSRKNHHLVEKAGALATELGVEIVFLDIGMYNDMFHETSEETKREWWTEDQMSRLAAPSPAARDAVCGYMYNDPFIDPDGRVYPCCHAAYAPRELLTNGYQNVFGSLQTHTLKEVWNNTYYQTARSLFSGRPSIAGDTKPICLKCKVYRERGPVVGLTGPRTRDPQRLVQIASNLAAPTQHPTIEAHRGKP